MEANRVEDVSRYIIERSIGYGKPITNLRLQKLLYFVQGFKLVDTNGQSGMFQESVVAWQFGPVVKESYFLFNRFGRDPIYDYMKTRSIVFEDSKFYVKEGEWENPLSEDDKDYLSRFVKAFTRFSNTDLVNMSHDPDGPWSEYYVENESNVIPKTALFSYFKKKLGGD